MSDVGKGRAQLTHVQTDATGGFAVRVAQRRGPSMERLLELEELTSPERFAPVSERRARRRASARAERASCCRTISTH